MKEAARRAVEVAEFQKKERSLAVDGLLSFFLLNSILLNLQRLSYTGSIW